MPCAHTYRRVGHLVLSAALHQLVDGGTSRRLTGLATRLQRLLLRHLLFVLGARLHQRQLPVTLLDALCDAPEGGATISLVLHD